MAVFNKNTLTQVSGFDNPIIAGELVYNQKTYWNFALTNSSGVINLTGATLNAQIIRREVSNLADSRTGLTFDIGNFLPTPSPIALTISNRVDASGTFTMTIDETAWGILATDLELDISISNPVCFSGRLMINFPAAGVTPADDNVIFLLFLIRSDGIYKV
jgi:hypothetical protein